MKKLTAGVFALGIMALSGAAQAATFQFTYDASFGTAIGTFDGDLNANGDTIDNMSNMIVELSTQPGVTNVGNPLAAGGFWSLSGLVANFITLAPVPAGMYISSGIVAFGDPIIQSEAYNPQNARVSMVGAVPLPAGLPLLLAGLGAFGIAARRKKAHKAA